MTDRPMALPDPWIPDDYNIFRQAFMFSASAFANGGLVVSNNDAHYIPIVPPCDVTLYSMSWVASNGLGNYDLGIYDSALRRLASSGSVAVSAAGVKTLALPEMRFRGGELFYAALALSLNTTQGLRVLNAVQILEGLGYGSEAAAFPLPATATPATAINVLTLPLIAFGVR